MGYIVVEKVLASEVANAATFTVPYPAKTDEGDFFGASGHYIYSYTYGQSAATFAFGTAEITITNASGVALAAGTKIWVHLDQPGVDDGRKTLANPLTMLPGNLYLINLGAPDTADANGAVESQACTAADGLATGINGALASGGVATFDRPRNVVAGWTNTAVLTVTGTDEYGNVVVESSASGTSLAGKKAFKTVTGISVSADVTGLTVGTGDVLGLPVFLPGAAYVMREMLDGAAATAGTTVAGVRTAATATTGDVRGTYDPNSAADGQRVFQLIAFLPDPGDKGVAQFAG
jgi:hypothetical protein